MTQFRNVCLLSEKSVKVLWDHFRQEAPDASFQFEKFLCSISDSLQTKEKEKVNMEVFIRSQHETREEEVSWKCSFIGTLNSFSLGKNTDKI